MTSTRKERIAQVKELQARFEQQEGRLAAAEFKAALRARISNLRDDWARAPINPLPLNHAHQLLDNREIEQAWIASLLELTRNAPAQVSTFGGFPPRFHGELVFTAFDDVAHRLQSNVITALKDGRVIASGIEAGKELKGKPQKVRAERWQLLTPNFDDSTATVDERTVLRQVTVDLVTEFASSPKPVSESKLKEKVLELWAGEGRNLTMTQACANIRRSVPGATRDRIRAALRKQGWKSKRGPRGPRQNNSAE
jgi:hypothetical protein